MRAGILLRVNLDEPQAAQLHRRIDRLPFKVTYREEQHGSQLIGMISCTPAQEKSVREILKDLDAPAIEVQG
jgi:hypothetical protein